MTNIKYKIQDLWEKKLKITLYNDSHENLVYQIISDGKLKKLVYVEAHSQTAFIYENPNDNIKIEILKGE
ncbi:hypothetical protein [Enterococcus cecorum]|uniref:hypothetical protein n=1 Tax=Enterococcus cecorum TaxID=44008 RepID=UPI00148E8343|nr:hypothetical protein [Enterococcus cecorum]